MNPAFPNRAILGIDVSKLTFDACLLRPEGAINKSFSNDAAGFAQLDAWLAQHRQGATLAGLEATGPYGMELLWHLHSMGHQVTQLNPRRLSDFARSRGRRVKTDPLDASNIATYLRSCDTLVLWTPPSQAILDLQALMRRRQDLLSARQAERNRMAAKPNPVVQDSLKRQIQHLDEEIKHIDSQLEALVLAHSELQKAVRLLRTIPGIGRLVAMSLIAEVPHLSAFQRARDLAAFVGLTPALAQSGTSVRRRGRMTKEGSALLRKMLYMAALQAVKRPANAFHKTYVEMTQRGKAKMCALGAIMHKLVRVAFGVLKHKTPFVENFARSSHTQ